MILESSRIRLGLLAVPLVAAPLVAMSGLPASAPASAQAVVTRPAPSHVSRSAARPPSSRPVPRASVPIERKLNPSNPLAGLPWGNARGPHEQLMDAYARAKGQQKRLLALAALHPKAHWFGQFSSKRLFKLVRHYIASATGGRPDVMVQFVDFAMSPWETTLCSRLATPAEQATYKRWTTTFAKAIGRTHATIILQPDGPFALCAPHHSHQPENLIKFSVRTFDALPNTTVYIEAGSADWRKPPAMVRMLRLDGVARVRGFALDTTHYDKTPSEIRYGTQIVKGLDRIGIENKHFVIDTVDNAQGFTYQHAPGPTHGTPRVCMSRTEHRCVTLGIPPTWRVDQPAWQLPPAVGRLAARNVDAYLWFGRPWLRGGINPFLLQRTLWMCRTTPFQRVH